METPKRRRRGAKKLRTEVLSIRLSPKIRYLAELAGRKQRRAVSSFVEWAVEEGLDKVQLKEACHSIDPAKGCEEYKPEITVAKAAAELWDVDEADRFIKLALRFPDLLTYEEQVLWKLIRENGSLWEGSYVGPEKKWTWPVIQSAFCFQRLREHWPAFVAVARGEKDRSELPTWSGPELIEREEDQHGEDI